MKSDRYSRGTFAAAGLAMLAALTAFGCSTLQSPDSLLDGAGLRINQLQVLGSHNSYSLGVDPQLMAMYAPRVGEVIDRRLAMVSAAARDQYRENHPNPGGISDGLGYAFPEGLIGQLDAGLRSLELDVNYDPDGGRFADPEGYKALVASGVAFSSLAPFNSRDLDKPGFKVFHIPDFDFRSSCNLFTACLAQLKSWSDGNPLHTPLFIIVEAKDQSIPVFENSRSGPAFDEAAFDALDAEILSVIPRERIVTPDMVRGSYATLEAGVLAKNWPTLESSRGKFVFLLMTALDTNGLSAYVDGHPNLEGRVAFLDSAPGQSHAAFMVFDNALARATDIPDLVSRGYIVRTRADIETYEARQNDQTRARAALASGAQIVSTDFYKPGNKYSTPYVVQLPGGGIARCNPVNALGPCP